MQSHEVRVVIPYYDLSKLGEAWEETPEIVPPECKSHGALLARSVNSHTRLDVKEAFYIPLLKKYLDDHDIPFDPLTDAKVGRFLKWFRESKYCTDMGDLKAYTAFDCYNVIKLWWVGQRYFEQFLLDFSAKDSQLLPKYPFGPICQRVENDLKRKMEVRAISIRANSLSLARPPKKFKAVVHKPKPYTAKQFRKFMQEALTRSVFSGDQCRTLCSFQYFMTMMFDECLDIRLDQLRYAVVNRKMPKDQTRRRIGLIVLVNEPVNTPQAEITHYAPIPRGKYPILCPWNALAVMLFHRWHILGQPIPDYASADWGISHLFADNMLAYSGRTAPQATRETALKQMGSLHTSLATNTTFSSDIFKVTCHSALEAGGFNKEKQLCLSRWRRDLKPEERKHANVINFGILDFLTSRNGHLRTSAYSSMARTTVEPPQELLDQVFPWVEEELRALDEKAANGDSQGGSLTGRDTYGFVGHIRLLAELRKVLLQDAAVMLKDPDLYFADKHPVFQHAIFQSPQFKAFQKRVMMKIWSEDQEIRGNPLGYPIANENSSFNKRAFGSQLSKIMSNLNTSRDSLSPKIEKPAHQERTPFSSPSDATHQEFPAVESPTRAAHIGFDRSAISTLGASTNGIIGTWNAAYSSLAILANDSFSLWLRGEQKIKSSEISTAEVIYHLVERQEVLNQIEFILDQMLFPDANGVEEHT